MRALRSSFAVPLFAMALIGATGEVAETEGSAASTETETLAHDYRDAINHNLQQNAAAHVQELMTDEGGCRDRITEARATNGLPPLMEREPASPDKPHAIYAVDRREAGCSVMVMMGNPNDVRPLPAPMEGPLQVIPAQVGK